MCPSVCPYGTISHKLFKILFWNITHLFLTSVSFVQSSFGKLEIKIPDFTPILYHALPQSSFRDLCIYSKSHMSAGSAAQIFNFFKSVPYLRAMCPTKFWTILIKMADLEPLLCQTGANSVRPARYLTNNLTFCCETLHIYLLPLCHSFSHVSENYNSKYQT